jgi:hypothetical protein
MYNHEEAVPSETKIIYDIENKNVKLRVDSGFGFWKILTHSVGPMDFVINMYNFNSDGAKLSMGAYDVEHTGFLIDRIEPPEIDNLYIYNNELMPILLGHLEGAHRTLSHTEFDIPPNSLLAEDNTFLLDIDTGNYGYYCGVTYVSIDIPFNIDISKISVEPEIPDTYSVLENTLYETIFNEVGDVELITKNDIKAGLKFDSENSDRIIKYEYELNTWKEKPFWNPKVEYSWKLIKANTENTIIISENSGISNDWDGKFLLNLPEIEGPYELILDFDIYNGDTFIKSLHQNHNMNVVFSSKNVTDEQIDEYLRSDDQLIQ